MKTNKYQRRFYRNWVGARDLFLSRLSVKETDLQILTDKPLDKKFVQERIRRYRSEIENYIDKERRFLTSLKPIAVELHAPRIIKEMSHAAREANVGPMAAVAGAIAQSLGRDLLKKGYQEVIIENGGDIFLKIRKIRKVGIYAGQNKIWNKLFLKIKPENTPLGVCASSGSLGHSLSFGRADSVIIFSQNAALADAVATACANRINSEKDLNKTLNFARSIKGVSGAVMMIKNNLISWGDFEFLLDKNNIL
ncbi:MAG: UPF0280 family protein [Candidatus Omnitrophica bacterium]|nr:UPF0280 family protein [Candidatus Omnitrophota bacterium]